MVGLERTTLLLESISLPCGRSQRKGQRKGPTMARVKSMRSGEKLFLDMEKRCPSAVGSVAVTATFSDFGLASGLQGNRYVLDIDILGTVKGHRS